MRSRMPVPHRVELLHALALVHDLRVFLGVAREADAAAQVVHREQVRLPRAVESAPAPAPRSTECISGRYFSS